MKAKHAPLVLTDFSILRSEIKFIPETRKDEYIEETLMSMSDYEIDIDFIIKNEKPAYHIVVKISINRSSNELPGYSIFAEAVSAFEFSNANSILKAEKDSMIKFSGLSVSISCIRSFIATQTSTYPYGKYTLPLIDLNDLLIQKSAQVKTPKSKK